MPRLKKSDERDLGEFVADCPGCGVSIRVIYDKRSKLIERMERDEELSPATLHHELVDPAVPRCPECGTMIEVEL